MIPPDSHHSVRVGIFEGPLDLLLHLVRINAVEITDIPIVEITRQYQEYLDLMREWNLEIASEFLLMASTLVQIKSRVLLPSPSIPDGEGETEDPREELVRQLLEHQKFQDAIIQLREGEKDQAKTRFRPPSAVLDFQEEFHLEVDLFDLLSAFKKILRESKGDQAAREIRRESFPIRSAMKWLLGRLPAAGKIRMGTTFRDLENLYKKIGVFLAMLELIRMGQIRAFQATSMGDIFICRTTTPPQRPKSPETAELTDREEFRG